MATVSRIRFHPIKSLDGVEADVVSIGGTGQLALDRKYAMFDEDGNYVNGRQNELVHRLQTTFDVETRSISISRRGGDEQHDFDLRSERDTARLEAWLSEYFGEPITVKRAQDSNYNDSAGGLAPSKINASGPTIVSTETYREIASWFPELEVEDVRRRFRANVEVEGTEPFWEDRLYSRGDRAVEFRIGRTTLYGIMPKPRCVVPTRDPDSGARDRAFVKTFVENREATFPDWATPEHLGQHIDLDVDHFFYLTTVTRIPRSEVGQTLQVGDEVSIEGEIPVLQTL